MTSIPLTLGPYRLIARIGKGGMAQVWRAQWIGAGGMIMACAVKVMLEEVALDERLRAMFLQEARLAMRLSHANICRILPTAGTDPYPYIAMEWINGLNLSELNDRLRMSRRQLPYDLIQYIIHSLLLALDAAHTLVVGGQPFPIIHRDVSPQNVMISVRGEVKLMDFGIARVLVNETSPIEYAGKLRYSPQEQIDGRIKPATDLYAVGAILHELVEGSLFRADCTSKSQMLAMINSGHTPVLTRPAVPENLRALHNALLRPKAEDRPQSAAEALEILGSVTAEQKALGQIITADLGAQAAMSGSTMGDFPVPSEVASIPDPQGQIDSVMPKPAKANEPVRVGGVIERTPTCVVSNPHAQVPQNAQGPEPDEGEGDSGAIPQPRVRPRARWVKIIEATEDPVGPEAEAALGAVRTKSAIDIGQHHSADQDAPVASLPEQVSDDLEATDTLPVWSPGARGDQRATTAQRVAGMTTSPSRKSRVLRWALILGVVPATGLLGAMGVYWMASAQNAASTPLRSGVRPSVEIQLAVGETWRTVEGPQSVPETARYQMRWRKDADSPWREAIGIQLEAGQHYVFEVTDGELLVRRRTSTQESGR